MNELLNNVIGDLERQGELLILGALGDLVKKGLIVQELGPLNIFEEFHGSYKYKVARSVKFVLKDKEHIEQLEKENQLLKERVEKIRYFLEVN